MHASEGANPSHVPNMALLADLRRFKCSRKCLRKVVVPHRHTDSGPGGVLHAGCVNQDGKLPALSREKRQDSEWLGRRAARSRKERRQVSAVAPGFCNHAGPHLLERRPARCSPEVTAGFCSTTGPARSSCPTARSPFFAGLKFRLARHRPGSARSG